MSTNVVRSIDTSVARVDMKFEVVVIPVSDVDRAKEFYARLGWRLDADFRFDNGFRVVQFTPPGSGCSVQFGTNITSAVPGSAQGLYLVVSDIEAARDELATRGVEVSNIFHPGTPGHSSSPTVHAVASTGHRPITPPMTPSRRSATRTATAGCCSKSRPGFPAESTPARQRLRRLRTWRARLSVRRPLTAITRSASAPPTRAGPTGPPRTWLRSKPGPSFRSERR